MTVLNNIVVVVACSVLRLGSGLTTGSAGQYRGADGYFSSSRGSSSGGSAGYSGGYGGGGRDSYSPSSGSAEEPKETKYYYGGKYQGNCVTDGLYYRDDTTFVICSNGYPHEQPCPPGTKTSGSPRYQPGYYYGYTDLCSVNLVDYGYGPEYYAPRGYPASHDGYEAPKGSGGYASEGRGSAGYGAGYERVGYGTPRESTDYGSGYGAASKPRKYDVSSVYGKKDVPVTYVSRDSSSSRYGSPAVDSTKNYADSASKPSLSVAGYHQYGAPASPDYLPSKSRDAYAQLAKNPYLGGL